MIEQRIGRMMAPALAALALAACGASPATTPASTPIANEDSGEPRLLTIHPSVRIMTAAEWEACETCDEQSLEGGAPVVFADLPAVSSDGALVAVTEERDGWGHVRHPGVRLVDRRSATAQWLPVDAVGAAAEAQATRASEALRAHRWLPLDVPTPEVTEVSESERRTTLRLGAFTVAYGQRFDGDIWKPPFSIRVTDASGATIVDRSDAEQAWGSGNATCNLPAFKLVGANADARVVLFATELGMGGHNCDGVEQPPAWHVLAY